MNTAIMPKVDYQNFCNAVRTLTNTDDDIKSGDVVSLIDNYAMPQLYDSTGKIYAEHVIIPETITSIPNARTYFINGIKSVYAPEVTSLGGDGIFGAPWNSMEEIICPKLTEWCTGSWCTGGNLKNVQAGSIGYPVTSMPNASGFRLNNRTDLVITIYVNATVLADIPTEITDYAPFGATNATIVYKNSTTGEVINA